MDAFLEKYGGWIFIGGFILFVTFISLHSPTPKPYKEGVQYFVYLFPDINSSMNYRLSADIIVEETCYSESDCEGDIQIETVYFENGETKYFGCSVYLKDENFCEDQDGKEWMIVMSDWEEAKSIQEIKDSKKRVDDVVNSVMD